MSRSLALKIFTLVIVLGMALTACQPQVQTIVVTEIVAGTPVEVEKVVTATPVPPTEAPPPAEVKPVDSIVIAQQQEPDTLHPMIGSMSAKTYVKNLFHVGCMSQNEKAEWVALGCEQVPTIENGGAKFVGEGEEKHLEVTYKIRKDWRWTDGVPVTSKDIIYIWKLAMDPNFEFEGRSAFLKFYDVVAADDKTAVVKFMTRQQINDAVAGTLTGNVDFKAFQADYEAMYGKDWPYYASDPVYWLIQESWMPAHILENIPGDQQAESDYARMPVGDGAYVVKEWKPNQELVLEASELPFPLGEPKIKTITFRFYGDSAGVLAALQSGEADLAHGNVAGLTESNGPDLDALEAGGAYKVTWVNGYSFEHMDINLDKEPLNDLKVRQALYYALDRQTIIDTLYYGKKVMTDLPLPKGLSWAYPPDSDITTYPYDVEKAKALLAEAGWDCNAMPCTKTVDGVEKKLEFTLMTTDRTDRIRLAQVVQQMWKKINIGVNLQFLYGRGLFATCAAGGPMNCGNYQAAIYTFSTNDDPGLYVTYACSQIPTEANSWSGQNWPRWCNQTAQDAVNQAENNPENVLSREKRKPYYATFFKEMTNDVPVVFFYGSNEPFPHVANWTNFKAGPTQFSYDTWNAWEWEVSK